MLGTFSLFGCDEVEAAYVEIDVENYGKIVVYVDPTYAPITVKNFLSLVDEGFYDGLTFHRIIDGFMIQGGDPKGDGTGGAAEKITGEFLSNGVLNTLWHERGVISMARGNDANSASSQFFIVTDAAAHLDGSYAAFGWVVGDGMTVVDAIAGGSYDFLDSNGSVPAKQQPRIVSVARTTYTGEDASDAYTYVKITFAYHTEQ
jgi:peptidyl-prolyl cis-trans isomerase B (cyclophilin B)